MKGLVEGSFGSPSPLIMKITEAENEYLGSKLTLEQMNDWLASRNMSSNSLMLYRYHQKRKIAAMRDAPLTDMPLHVITPCTRPHNLASISQSITKANSPHNFRIHWHVIFKNHENRFNLIKVYNDLLDSIKTGWITFMCDDNQFHPEIFVELERAMRDNPQMGVFICSIIGRHGKVYKASKESVLPFGIDAAQTFIERSTLGDIRYNTYKLREADSKIVRDLYKKCPERFVFSEKVLAYYERLIRDDSGELYHEKDGIIGA